MGHSNDTVKNACINTYKQEVRKAFSIYSAILKAVQEEIKEDNSLYVRIKNCILKEYRISEEDINATLTNSNNELRLQGYVSTYYTEDFNHRGYFHEYFSTKNEFNFVIEDKLKEVEEKKLQEKRTKVTINLALKKIEAYKLKEKEKELKEEIENLTKELNTL